jgi:hypothetical protein
LAASFAINAVYDRLPLEELDRESVPAGEVQQQQPAASSQQPAASSQQPAASQSSGVTGSGGGQVGGGGNDGSSGGGGVPLYNLGVMVWEATLLPVMAKEIICLLVQQVYILNEYIPLASY